MNRIGFKSCDTRSHDQSCDLDVLKREVNRLQTEAVKLIEENEKCIFCLRYITNYNWI